MNTLIRKGISILSVATMSVALVGVAAAQLLPQEPAAEPVQPRPLPAGEVAPEATPPAVLAPVPAPGGAVHLPNALPAAPPNKPLLPGATDYSRPNQIRLAADGYLPARVLVRDPATNEIVPAKNLSLTFWREDQFVTAARPGEAGVAQVSGLAPGIYSVIAIGPEGYLASGVEVLPYKAIKKENAAGDETAARAQPRIVPAAAQVEVVQEETQTPVMLERLAIAPQDMDLVLRMIERGLVMAAGNPAQDAVVTNDPAVPPVAGAVPVEPDETLTVEVEQQARPVTALANHEVVLEPDGRLVGRLYALSPQTGAPVTIRQTTIGFVNKNRVVAQAPVGRDGAYEIPRLTPGSYSVYVTGADGYGALGVDVVSPADETALLPTLNWLLPTALLAPPPNPGNGLNLMLANNKTFQAAAGNGNQGQGGNTVAPLGGNGGGGSVGGGGVGGGGGDFLTGAIFAGVGTGAGFLLADDDNNDEASPSTTSPTP